MRAAEVKNDLVKVVNFKQLLAVIALVATLWTGLVLPATLYQIGNMVDDKVKNHNQTTHPNTVTHIELKYLLDGFLIEPRTP